VAWRSRPGVPGLAFPVWAATAGLATFRLFRARKWRIPGAELHVAWAGNVGCGRVVALTVMRKSPETATVVGPGGRKGH